MFLTFFSFITHLQHCIEYTYIISIFTLNGKKATKCIMIPYCFLVFLLKAKLQHKLNEKMKDISWKRLYYFKTMFEFLCHHIL